MSDRDSNPSSTGQLPAPGGRFVEDDEGGTIATNPHANAGEAALPFRATPPPNAGLPSAYTQQQLSRAPAATQPAPVAPSYTTPAYVAPSPATPWPSAPPPAPPPPVSNNWGAGQASAFVATPRPVAPQHQLRRSEDEMQRAAALGVSAVSNAAIPVDTAPSKPIASSGSVKVKAPVEEPQRASVRVELLAVERHDMDRVRTSKHLVEKATDELVDEWQSSEPQAQTTLEAKDRASAHRSLVRATPMVQDELEPALGAALDESTGSYPVVLVAGELTIGLDPHDVLRALRGYAAAWSTAQDKRLGEALELVDAVLGAPIVLPDAVQIARARLDEALRASNRPGLRDVEPVIDRALIEQRSFARRSVFGDRRVLAHLDGSSTPLPVYLNDTISRELPLMKKFLARIIVEVRPQQDSSEAHPIALRAIALGRIVPQSRAPRR